MRNLIIGALLGGLAIWFLLEHPEAAEDAWHEVRGWFDKGESTASGLVEDIADGVERAGDRVGDTLRDIGSDR